MFFEFARTFLSCELFIFNKSCLLSCICPALEFLLVQRQEAGHHGSGGVLPRSPLGASGDSGKNTESLRTLSDILPTKGKHVVFHKGQELSTFCGFISSEAQHSSTAKPPYQLQVALKFQVFRHVKTETSSPPHCCP